VGGVGDFVPLVIITMAGSKIKEGGGSVQKMKRVQINIWVVFYGGLDKFGPGSGGSDMFFRGRY
jgi:hypothetical protein